MEISRMGVTYIHLIACCIAIGMIFTSDLAMVRQLLTGRGEERVDARHLDTLQHTVTAALAALWITGLGIVAIDVWFKGYEVLLNPKLQAKGAIVLLLTFNGALLHRAVLPAMKKAGSVLRLDLNQRLLALFAGSMSAVSWFYAAMLGIGRPLNFKYPLHEILAPFPALVLGGFAGMLLLTAFAKYRGTMISPMLRTA
ncbi:MAG: hypothetical protein JWP36_1692 [Paucimonas sp.]|nr:hypothetical protein [Paucimonas sp.]